MSKIGVYVKVNGIYYSDPTYHGDDWFICFDNDEPIELVIESMNRVNSVLCHMGIDCMCWDYNAQNLRVFPPRYEEFRGAHSLWLKPQSGYKWPVPRIYDKKTKKCPFNAVIYGGL